MDSIYQHYIIDLSSNNNFVQIPTVQGDGNNIRGFEVELIQNGMQYIIDKDDTIISIMGTKPDTKQIMNPCEVTDEGYILVDITSQMAAVTGRGDYQIVLMSRQTNSQLKSFPFHILTTPATFDIDHIVSSDEFQLLTRSITRIDDVIVNANQVISDVRDLESSVEKSESSRVDAEIERVNAEENRVSNESTRQSSENIRKQNEEGRQNAESGRVDAENIRVEYENTRIINENTRISNENTREQNEDGRQNAESDRVNAELGRIDSETDRVVAENIRIANENVRKTAETERITEEAKRENAEEIRIDNESVRQSNESTRQENESIRQTDTATAIADANDATTRANEAAGICEGIVAGILPTASNTVSGIVKIGDNITVNGGIISISNKNIINALGFTPIKKTDTTTELLSSTEPTSGSQNVCDFWLQEY